MFTKFLKQVKNAKGFTLVELLAVIVILGIIAAIAVPSVSGVIAKSKKDATVSNAEQLIEGARLLVTTDNVDVSDGVDINVYSSGDNQKGLEEEGFIEDGLVDTTGEAYDSSSHVHVEEGEDGKVVYSVYLKGSKYQIGSSSELVKRKDLARDKVTKVSE
ncbi:type II secretion system protein [Halobacillus rhizosphaerae]|uniref:type II secretion system protein n=1 Tax=Halobacillus rhizosphaerae TaxID=3064889 RepID=UPI00398B3CAF